MLKKIVIIISLFLLLLLYLLYGNKLNINICCPFYEIFHLYCPGCGVTRMLKSIIELDFYQAFRYNMLVFILSPLLVTYVILEIRYFLTKKENILNQKKYQTFLIIILIITILFGILRNIEWFSFLKPTKI